MLEPQLASSLKVGADVILKVGLCQLRGFIQNLQKQLTCQYAWGSSEMQPFRLFCVMMRRCVY